MMPTERGFIEALGIGRAGQVEANVLHGDGSVALYTITDLDADPERFNERLSKFGILRDAMDRAEPVEIEFPFDDGGRPIDRVKRLTRDALARPTSTTVAEGMVVGLAVSFEVATGPRGEATDRADLIIMTEFGNQGLTIALQSPERSTGMAMVDMLRAAQAAGQSVQVTYDAKDMLVTRVAISDVMGLGQGVDTDRFSAFVETISHLPQSNLMLITVTTAPEFQTDGNVVPLLDFDPSRRGLAVVRGAPEYALLEIALRDKLRVELLTSRPRRDDDGGDEGGDDNDSTNDGPRVVGAAAVVIPEVYLVRGATVQHALCSASRPVWIEINRRALDIGPDAECMDGLPSNDMRPRSLRELNLPYRAAWIGMGCFNHGVYRIQIRSGLMIAVLVDGEPICLHSGAEPGLIFGHACLEGDHEVQVVIENWKCSAEFDIDVYRIR
jgi:hypothetical protein